MGRADFPDSAHICIIQEFLGMSIRPAQNKLVLQVASDQTLFKIDFKLGVDLREYPKVCVNLQTDVRYNYSVWRLFLWQEEKTAHKKQQ